MASRASAPGFSRSGIGLRANLAGSADAGTRPHASVRRWATGRNSTVVPTLTRKRKGSRGDLAELSAKNLALVGKRSWTRAAGILVVVLGPDWFSTPWAAGQIYYSGEACRIVGAPRPLHSVGVHLSVITDVVQLVPPDAPIYDDEHIALARVFAAPMQALSPQIATDVGALAAHTTPQDIRRVVWVCRLRVVVRHSELVLALHRLDAAIAEQERRHHNAGLHSKFRAVPVRTGGHKPPRGALWSRPARHTHAKSGQGRSN